MTTEMYIFSAGLYVNSNCKHCKSFYCVPEYFNNLVLQKSTFLFTIIVKRQTIV